MFRVPLDYKDWRSVTALASPFGFTFTERPFFDQHCSFFLLPSLFCLSARNDLNVKRLCGSCWKNHFIHLPLLVNVENSSTQKERSCAFFFLLSHWFFAPFTTRKSKHTSLCKTQQLTFNTD